MIEPDALHRAVDLQRRSYRLLRWASEAVDKGRLEFETLHETASLKDFTLSAEAILAAEAQLTDRLRASA